MDDMGKRDALMNQFAEIEDYFAGCAENAAKGSKAEVHFMVLKNAAKIAREKLKAQEPVKPYIDYDGQDVWRCGSCGATLFHLSHTQADENEQNCVKFCRYCGRAVKWDG